MTKEQLKQALNVCSEYETCERCPAHEYCGDLAIVTSEALNIIEKLETNAKEAREITQKGKPGIRLILEAKPLLAELVETLADTFAFDTSEELTEIVREFMEESGISEYMSIMVEVQDK